MNRDKNEPGNNIAFQQVWSTYVLVSDTGTYYTGITPYLAERLREHNASKSRATRGRSWAFRFIIGGVNRCEAARIEKWLKSGDTPAKRGYLEKIALPWYDDYILLKTSHARGYIPGCKIVAYLDARAKARADISRRIADMEEDVFDGRVGYPQPPYE